MTEELFENYKGQSKVERGFRFLKDPQFIAATLFVKKPERIEALLFIMTKIAQKNKHLLTTR